MKGISFEWSSDLESGIKILDLQHKTFLVSFLKFSKDCESGVAEKTLISTLSFLNSYVTEHLRLEEALMEIIKYPREGSHKSSHSEFKSKIAALTANFENYVLPSNTIFSSNYLMTDWWLKHIRFEDAALSKALLEKMREPEVKAQVDALLVAYDPKTGGLIKRR